MAEGPGTRRITVGIIDIARRSRVLSARRTSSTASASTATDMYGAGRQSFGRSLSDISWLFRRTGIGIHPAISLVGCGRGCGCGRRGGGIVIVIGTPEPNRTDSCRSGQIPRTITLCRLRALLRGEYRPPAVAANGSADARFRGRCCLLLVRWCRHFLIGTRMSRVHASFSTNKCKSDSALSTQASESEQAINNASPLLFA